MDIIRIIRTGNSPSLRQRRKRKDLDCSQVKRGQRNRINRFSLLTFSVGLFPPSFVLLTFIECPQCVPDSELTWPSTVAWFPFTKATSYTDFIPWRLPLLDCKLPEGRVHAIFVLHVHTEDRINLGRINEWIRVVVSDVIPAIPKLDCTLPMAEMRRAFWRCEITCLSSREQSQGH